MAATVDIDDELERRIRRLADARLDTPDRLVREAIRQYADRAEARQGFLEEADASLAAFEADGFHLTGAEVRAWLQDLQTDANVAMPECHK